VAIFGEDLSDKYHPEVEQQAEPGQ
jgi:hypothetical protein